MAGYWATYCNGPDKKERTKRNEHVGMQKVGNFTIVPTTLLIGLNITFNKVFAKQQVIKAYFKISCFLLVTKSHQSLSNAENLCTEHVNCKLFLAIVCNSYDWSKSFNTENHPLKMAFKYILFRKLTFCRLMHSRCESENIPM